MCCGYVETFHSSEPRRTLFISLKYRIINRYLLAYSLLSELRCILKRRYQINSIAHILGFLGVTQRAVAMRTGVSRSAISRMAETHWNELEYDVVVNVLEGVYHDSIEGKFEVEKTRDGMVASVTFVYSTK